MLLRTLNTLQIDVPGRIAIAGFDDVKYAKLLGVPLTTVAQPCQEIGVAAVNTMLSRISDPELPPRTVLLEPSLVIRESCGQDRHDSSK
jgi:LacI family transcriptional regulator